jgi:acid phosphatase (class A)
MRKTLLALVLVLTSGLARAENVAAPSSFLPPIDVALILPPPPASGSQQARTEIAELRRLSRSRWPEAFATAVRYDKDESGDTFADAIGPGFDLAKLPDTAKMLSDILSVETALTKPAKEHFARDRPWIADPSLKTCVAHKPGPARNSYPSGHATVAYAMGVVLAALMPDRAQAILSQSANFAESRLVCAVHFRSDIVAGQVLGTVIGFELLNDPLFKPEYDAAKAELDAAHLR